MNSQYSLATKIKKGPTNDARREQNCNNHSRKSATKLKGLYLQQQILQLSTRHAKEEICFVVSAEQQRQLEIIMAITAASSYEHFQALPSCVAFIQYLCSGVFYNNLKLKQAMERIYKPNPERCLN